jgi:hypothetical protein
LIELHISKSFNDDGSAEIYFVGVNFWDEFEIILELLQNDNKCKVLSNKEMIYIRKAELSWENINFELIHDDMLGNYISSHNPIDYDKLEKMANHVIESIMDKQV